ncbi:MAG: glycosyltransferase family 2 protein [Roseburia sp.]|nr:glycosyltransferase family 2 protein [Roseburia sp.]
MNISIGIVAYNEEKNLPGILEDVIKQTYPHDQMEIVLVDSRSEDQTKQVMQEFSEQHAGGFLAVQIVDNPGRLQSCGWNQAIDAFTTEVLIRIDAHSSIPADFVERNVKALAEGEFVTGGIRPNIVESDSEWQQVLLTAESSMFGSSAASFRRGNAASGQNEEKKAYVKSFFHGAYRREVFEKAGKFREDLGRTEDNEFHFRLRQNGFRLCLVPGIISYQMIRPGLGKMCRQKFSNGYWIGLTSGVCPGCLSLYHFVPFAFLCGIIVTTVLAVCAHPFWAFFMWGAYWILAVLMAVMAVRGGKKYPGHLLLPVLFFLLHISYGAGTFVGLVKMPFWRGKHIGAKNE